MRNLNYKSVMSGSRYKADMALPDFERDENGKFSRGQTLGTILKAEYGYVDETGLEVVVSDVTDEKTDVDYGYFFCGKATHTALEFALTKNGRTATFICDLFIPTRVKEYKTVVHLDFMRMLPTKYCPVEELMDGGLAIAHLYYKEIASDDNDFSNGIAPLFVDRNDLDSAGKLTLWSFAATLVGRYLISRGYAAKETLYVAGHSRLGKTALLTAARDENFAGCMVNCSGCCGAAISRDKRGETVPAIINVFPFWFTPRFDETYKGGIDGMPFDQHFLMASVAPRKVFVVAASEDDWADTDAQYLCCEVAGEAYKEYGLTGLTPMKSRPAEGDRNDTGEIKFFHRVGPHFFSREDWKFYIKCLQD